MNAIQVTPNGLEWLPTPDPVPQQDEVLIDVKAAGVNRADLLQAAGHYPPPPGASTILGLELAGLHDGLPVCCLVPGGAYAEKAAVHRSMLLPIPEDWPFSKAAAIPEAWLTAFVNLFMEARLATGESVLIHAGASGVGLAAIQMAREAGAVVYTTVRTASKVAFCESFGATVVDPTGPFPEADVILDCVGGSYLEKNIQALKRFGRMVSPPYCATGSASLVPRCAAARAPSRSKSPRNSNCASGRTSSTAHSKPPLTASSPSNRPARPTATWPKTRTWARSF
jgi:NADPH:quinone reductase-like Zn-dependent oxidoreductase